jgi:two-component system, response regulator / RNA-binding antiterminator
MPTGMKIMLVDESTERSLFMRLTLERLGHDIVAEIADSGRLYEAVRSHAPDAIIIDTESPSRDTLEHLCMITESCPRPIVMFTEDAKRESIREAVRAGVTAYIVDGLAAERIEPIIETAVARFEAFQSVQTELAQTRSKLSERKLVERAKGILMKEKSLSEEDAFRMLRKLAMDRSAPMATVAEQVITYARLLG